RCLGTAGALQYRASRRVQTTPQIELKTSARVRRIHFCARRLVQRIQLHRMRTKEDVMSETSATRRDVLATSAAAGAATLLPTGPAAGADENAIRAFRIDVPEAKLVDLRR